jgi:hypothetical protein
VGKKHTFLILAPHLSGFNLSESLFSHLQNGHKKTSWQVCHEEEVSLLGHFLGSVSKSIKLWGLELGSP